MVGKQSISSAPCHFTQEAEFYRPGNQRLGVRKCQIRPLQEWTPFSANDGRLTNAAQRVAAYTWFLREEARGWTPLVP
jgi:hypothetical protein